MSEQMSSIEGYTDWKASEKSEQAVEQPQVETQQATTEEQPSEQASIFKRMKTAFRGLALGAALFGASAGMDSDNKVEASAQDFLMGKTAVEATLQRDSAENGRVSGDKVQKIREAVDKVMTQKQEQYVAGGRKLIPEEMRTLNQQSIEEARQKLQE
jgi:hypothetical protein